MEMPRSGPGMLRDVPRLARHCVWWSGAAHAAPGGHRRHLLGLKARRSELKKFTTGSATRVIRSNSLLLALRPSRWRRWPPGAAWAATDHHTHCLPSLGTSLSIPGPLRDISILFMVLFFLIFSWFYAYFSWFFVYFFLVFCLFLFVQNPEKSKDLYTLKKYKTI